MKTTPKLSVIIATYDGTRTLPLQLEALATQSDCPPFEVIIVDNGSTEDVGAVARPWESQLDLHLLRADRAQGIAYARNAGVAVARTALLAFCDDDDVVGEGWVAAAVHYLEHHAFVSGYGLELPDAEFSTVASARRHLPPMPSVPEATPSPVLGDYPILLGGNCAIRRGVLDALGGFDHRFDPGAEEKDLVLRFMATGGTLMKADGMQLAVRLRATKSRQLRRSFDHGRMYMKLVETHGLSATSPVVNHPDFRWDLLRALGALIKSALTRPSHSGAALNRCALRTGQVIGWVEHSLLPRILRRPHSRPLQSCAASHD